MFNRIIHQLFYKRISQPIIRNYSEQLFQSVEVQNEFSKNGFVHLKNVLPKDIISELMVVFNNVKEHQEYQKTDYFINSVAFQSNDIKKYTREEVSKLIRKELNTFLLAEKLRFPISVGFCINPANSVRGSRAHQDPNLVDETNAYSLVLWIPLVNSNLENGCLHLLQGSHLWGNHIRSNYHVNWKFDEFVDNIIQENLEPIETNVGDIIIFDPALIHASSINKTNEDRVAIQISTIPNSQKLVNVVQENKLPFPIAKYFNIDEAYFTNESVVFHPSEKYEIIKTEKIDYYYTKNSIRKLLEVK